MLSPFFLGCVGAAAAAERRQGAAVAIVFFRPRGPAAAAAVQIHLHVRPAETEVNFVRGVVKRPHMSPYVKPLVMPVYVNTVGEDCGARASTKSASFRSATAAAANVFVDFSSLFNDIF